MKRPAKIGAAAAVARLSGWQVADGRDHPAVIPVGRLAVLRWEREHRPSVVAEGEDVTAVDFDAPTLHQETAWSRSTR